MTNDYHDRRRGTSDRNAGQGPTTHDSDTIEMPGKYDHHDSDSIAMPGKARRNIS